MAPGAVYALVVLFAINLMNFFDRQIIGGVGEGIRREWGLSDTALGLLGTVFTLLYAVVGLPLGRLSDRIQRRRILAAGVFVWSLLTARLGRRPQLLTADRGAARRRRRRGDLLAGVHVAHRRPLPDDAARAGGGDLDARAAARPRPRERRRRMDPPELGLAQRVLRRGGAGHPVRDRGAHAFANRARGTVEEHAIGDRRRPGNPYLLVLSIPTMLWIIVSGALHNFNMYALGSFVAPFLVRFHQMNFLDAGWIAAARLRFLGHRRPRRRRHAGGPSLSPAGRRPADRRAWARS